MAKLTKYYKEIKQTINKITPKLKEKFNVERIGIFGSYVHGTASFASDIDLLVEFSGTIGWEFIDLKEYLEKVLGKRVDLVTKKALKPQLKEAILKEVIYV